MMYYINQMSYDSCTQYSFTVGIPKILMGKMMVVSGTIIKCSKVDPRSMEIVVRDLGLFKEVDQSALIISDEGDVLAFRSIFVAPSTGDYIKVYIRDDGAATWGLSPVDNLRLELYEDNK